MNSGYRYRPRDRYGTTPFSVLNTQYSKLFYECSHAHADSIIQHARHSSVACWPASSASLIRYGFSRRCVAWKRPPGSPCASSTASEPALPAGLHHRALTLSPRRRRRRRRHASTSPRAQVPRPHLILSSDAVRGESREPAERGLLDVSEARAGTRAPTVSVAVPRSRSGPGPNGSLSVSRRPGSGSWQAPA